MMYRRTAKDSFSAAEAVISHLEHDADGFDDEDAADHQQEGFMACYYGGIANGASQGQRSDISHKYLGGVAIEPQESKTGATYRGAQNR